MITLRTFATVFIINKDRILLMERSGNRNFAPGLWAPVGGHVEPNELNTPRKTCLRELEEETGLTETDIYDLDLKYIVLRKSDLEIRIQYVYFCKTDKDYQKQTDEGILYWIDKENIFNRELSYTTRTTLKHYFENHNKLNKILVGVVDEYKGSPVMNWNYIEDWDSKSFN